MPNTMDNVWIYLFITALILFLGLIIFKFLKNQFNARLQLHLIKEKSLLEEVNILKNQNLDLNQQREKLTLVNNSLSTHKTFLEDKLDELKSQVDVLNSKLYDADIHKNDLQISLTQASAENENLTQKLVEDRKQLEDLNKKLNLEFENLAQKILDEKSEKFAKQNQENLNFILNPLQQKIQGFEKRVEDTHKESIEHGAKLRQQIIGLKELNEQMSKEANNLTRALKGEFKTQGNWGEMILESVLEKSGLQKNVEYFVQSTLYTEDGKRFMPDVVIELPGSKKVIIDSKVSLVAYEKYVNETDEIQRKIWEKQHLSSIERHINDLSRKNYHKLYQVETLDFVLMFIPIESAFALASQSAPFLYRDAFEKNIILVTPTTLLAVLRTIDTLWQNEKQKKNALDIATQAGRLYDTFSNLLDDFLKMGRQLDSAKNAYDDSMKKLTGNQNLFKNIENLKRLGAKTSKELDEKILKSVEINQEEDGYI